MIDPTPKDQLWDNHAVSIKNETEWDSGDLSAGNQDISHCTHFRSDRDLLQTICDTLGQKLPIVIRQPRKGGGRLHFLL